MAQMKPHYDAAIASDAIIKQDDGSFKISPKGLNIVWGNEDSYWRKLEKENDPAELIQVCWLEVTGSVPVEAGKKYAISFKVSLKLGAFGWNNCRVYVKAKVGKKGRYTWKKAKLNKYEETEIPPIPLTVSVDSHVKEKTLYFGLYEVRSGWKGGLKIHEAYVKVVNN